MMTSDPNLRHQTALLAGGDRKSESCYLHSNKSPKGLNLSVRPGVNKRYQAIAKPKKQLERGDYSGKGDTARTAGQESDNNIIITNAVNK